MGVHAMASTTNSVNGLATCLACHRSEVAGSKLQLSRGSTLGYPAVGISRSHRTRQFGLQVRAGIKAVESYDTSFELQAEARETLVRLLASETFCKQVASQPGVPEGSVMEFSGELFQPVPWSPTTKHGMPQELEKYLFDKENYVIINVPPNFMFNANIFKPSRLCAIYKRIAQ